MQYATLTTLLLSSDVRWLLHATLARSQRPTFVALTRESHIAFLVAERNS